MHRLTNILSVAIGIAIVATPALAGPTVSLPEPATITLMAVGIAGVAWVKFRGKK